MEKMTRKEFIESKQRAKKPHQGIFVSLTKEESNELYKKASALGVSRAVYARSILFYSD